MKKIVVLAFLGSFMLTMGLLLKFVAYPQLAVVPANLSSSVIAQSPSEAPATYFSIPDLEEKSAVLRSVTKAQVMADESKKLAASTGRDVLVIRTYACTDLATKDCSTLRYPLTGALSIFAIDKRTGKAVDWSGSSSETGGKIEKDVPYEGLLIKFPFNAQKKTYQFWNASLERTVPVNYEGTSTLEGLKVYKYTQSMKPTALSQAELPGSVLGSSQASVAADLVSSGSTTYYVEPETGVIISAVANLDNYAAVDGERVLTTTKGTFISPDADIKKAATEYRGLSKSLFVVRVIGPVVGVGLGVLLLGAAVLVALARRRSARRRQDETPVAHADASTRTAPALRG